MRTIQISTHVFSRIWAARQEGEETEDAILNRLLPGRPQEAEAPHQSGRAVVAGGHTERSYGVAFPGGFEIFRTYLGNSYRASAVADGWRSDKDGKTYPTLNELSKGIGAKVENAWANWFYSGPSGERKPVSSLRDPGKVTRRTRGPVEVDKLIAEIDAPPQKNPT